MTRRRLRPVIAGAVVAALWIASPSVADAQATREPLPGRFEMAAGPTWIGHAALGARNAALTAVDGGRFPLFSTATDMNAGAGLEGRVGVRLTRLFQVEAGVSRTRPRIVTRVTGDLEGASAVTVTDPIQQWIVEGSVLLHLPRLRLGARGVPFIAAGAGYMRQLHDGAALVQTGHTYSVGGGLKFALAARPRRFLKGVGVRADARALLRVKGAAFDELARTSPALSASLYLRLW